MSAQKKRRIKQWCDQGKQVLAVGIKMGKKRKLRCPECNKLLETQWLEYGPYDEYQEVISAHKKWVKI